VNESDETRKRFEILCREVFKKFVACVNVPGVHGYRARRDALDVIYKSLQRDLEETDISDILRQLHQIVDEVITTEASQIGEARAPYDISQIDFDLLRKEFEKAPAKNTTVQNLKNAIDQRLQRLLQQNPTRTNLQQEYDEIVDQYNREKDRVTIEQTFGELLEYVQGLSQEESRAVREGLDEETLAIYDLLMKSDLSGSDIKQIKSIAVELLAILKAEISRVAQWREKEATRDIVRKAIRDFLYEERTGLPVGVYSEEDVFKTADAVYAHVYQSYPTVPSPFYGVAG
jgi:type I restriction enzyme, R subunit